MPRLDNLAVRELRLLEKARFVKLAAGLDAAARKALWERFHEIGNSPVGRLPI